MTDKLNVASFWNHFSWDQAPRLLEADSRVMKEVSMIARERTVQIFGPAIKLFFPGATFPAISITGDQCALACLHCNKNYPNNMMQALTPEDILALCRGLDACKAVGCLISGGCNESGSVPISPYLDKIAAQGIASVRFNSCCAIPPSLYEKARGG